MLQDKGWVGPPASALHPLSMASHVFLEVTISSRQGPASQHHRKHLPSILQEVLFHKELLFQVDAPSPSLPVLLRPALITIASLAMDLSWI